MAIDLYCGLGGWAEGFLAEDYDVIGFDIERPGAPGYPGQLVLQDVLTLHGSQFAGATVIVASPPCQAYSYRAMPWKRAKALPPPSNELFDACFRIQREACEAAGRYIPLIVENVKGAQPWVGRAKWHYGSYYLWGDIPALMPFAHGAMKAGDRNIGRENGEHRWSHSFADSIKVKGQDWNMQAIKGNPPRGDGERPNGTGRASWFFRQRADPRDSAAVKQHGSGPIWFDNGIAKFGSRSDARKMASALIAKIPFPLAQHVAKVYKSGRT